ncbi:MAG: hypothetical protein Q9167_007657 [Letrouitia subvulpina]
MALETFGDPYEDGTISQGERSLILIEFSSGGLGHIGILFANALGAEVYALSHSPNEEQDALEMGAKEFILTSKKDLAKDWAFELDFILNTTDTTNTFNIQEYMSTLNVDGEFHNVNLPDEPLPRIIAQNFMLSAAKIGASNISKHPEMFAMLKMAVKRVNRTDVRYGFTLTSYDGKWG